MRKSFKDSLKVLEADIQHANTLYVHGASLNLVSVFFPLYKESCLLSSWGHGSYGRR